MRRTSLLLALCLGACGPAPKSAPEPARESAAAAAATPADDPRPLPDVLLIFADDLGLGDVSATNPESRIETPNLARLAEEGLTFTDAHTASSVCTPSRYALLTGRYCWRTELDRGVFWGDSPPLLDPGRPTIAHLLREAGYRTQMLGKWHLGWTWGVANGRVDWDAPVTDGPDAAGFDGYRAMAASLDQPPYVWVEDGQVTAPPDRMRGVRPEDDRYGWFRTGAIGADVTMREVLPDLFERAGAFVRERAAPDEPYFLYLALTAPHTPILPTSAFEGASGLNPYADFVRQIDHHVGALLDALEESGRVDQTLVIFTSDNGCAPQAHLELLRANGHDPSAGYRGHKAGLYEGAHRVPLIVRWPGRVPAGATTDALVCLTDLYPTLAELIGAETGPVGGEDGYSFARLFEGATSTDRDRIVHHSFEGRFAYRRGPWKLILAPGSGGWSPPTDEEARRLGRPPVQLYHLERDPAETTNLAAEEPQLVDELVDELAAAIAAGRSTPGPELSNDREVEFLPEDFERRREPDRAR